jgi:hypothetical protein
MSKLNVIIAGSTGMVGKGMLLECIDHPEVESILLINRNPIDISHPKIKEVLVKDFFNLDPIRNDLQGYNTCFYSLGVTSVGANEADYSRIMYDMTMVFAKEVLHQNPDMTFCFVSGKGTDSSEKGKFMWARVKGKTENAILSLGFKDAYMFRPGHIQPRKGIRSRTGWYNIYYGILGSFYFLLKRIPSFVTDTETMGKAMINVALTGYPKKILESIDINKVGR